MSNQLPNNDDLMKQLLGTLSKKPNKFVKAKCAFCGTTFYPTDHLPKYCTYTCNIMSAEIKGAMVAQEAYKAVKKFDEKAIEWQKTMAVMEEEYNRQQKEAEELQKKELTVEPAVKEEAKKIPKKFLFYFGEDSKK